MRKIVATGLSLGLLTVAVPVTAAPCKDPKTGKFVKCPPAASAKAIRCKAANSKFTKCGTSGAKRIWSDTTQSATIVVL